MNIKACLHRATLLAAALAAASTARANFPVPDPVTAVLVSSGPANGSILLNWLSGSDGNGGTAPADRYEIRYRFNHTIDTEADWLNATRIDQPPTNLAPVAPLPASTSQFMLITGLEPGVTYGFAIRTFVGVSSAPFAPSLTAVATSSCQQDPNDGLSVSAVSCFTPTIKAGKTTNFDLTIAISTPGVAQGGKVTMRVPDFWPRPSTSTVNNGIPGYTSITATLGMTFSLDDDGTLVFTNNNPSTIIGGNIQFTYLGYTCESTGVRKFVTSSQYSSCGLLTTTGHDFVFSVVQGDPEFVDFQSYDLTVVQGVAAKIGLRVTDSCRNPVISTVAIPVTVSSEYRDASVFQILPDTFTAFVSTSPTGVPALQNVNVLVPSFSSATTFYYRVTSTAHKPENYIHVQHQDLVNTFQQNWYANVRVVNNGIAAPSVDTGLFSANPQTSVTFTPDGDGIADSAFINFSVPEPVAWMVEILDGSQAVVRHLYGNSILARVAWDGFTDGTPGLPQQIAAPGIYQARISFGGGAVADTSLTMTLSAAGVTSTVVDSTLTPLADVDVNIFGPTNRYARTTSSGAFSVYGLKPGVYTVEVRKQGYSTVDTTVNVGSGVLNLASITMVKQSIIKMFVTRPSGDDLPEIYGQVRVNNSDWSKQDSETVHFGRGKTQADAGDTFNAIPTPYTTLTLAPTVQYRIHFDVPNLKIADSTATLTSNEARPVYADLLRSANVAGNVTVPGANPNGIWVSVEAGLDANLDGIYDSQDSTGRYYGGVWLSPGDTTARYQIFGVNNASYTLTATAPGYTPIRRQVVVSGDVDATADFPAFDIGGVITGTITVSGDTSALDVLDGVTDGFFAVPVNAFSSALQVGSYQQVKLSTSATGSSGTFTITGLANGTYDISPNLQGYELIPAGRRTVTVSGGTGSVALNFQPFTGGITGDITLPSGQTDYNQISIEIAPFDFNLSKVTVVPSSATYTTSGLGTGYYVLTAVYGTSGLTITKNVQIVNGKTVRVDLDLSGQTFSISGRVLTSARAPFNDLTYLVTASTPTKLTDTSNGNSVTLPANRIAVERVGGSTNNNPSAATTLTGAAYYDSRQTFFVTYDSSGAFTVPKLTPGSYRLKNNGEIDGDLTNGPEIAEATLVVRVATANATNQLLGVIDGYDVKGTVRMGAAQLPAGRPVMLRLKNAAGTVISEQAAVLSGTSVDFTISRIPNGDYVLSSEDDQYPKSFSARDVRVSVAGASPDPLTIDLLQPAQIRGKMRLKSSMTLLTSRNYDQYLSSNFSIQAQANPWFSGGSYQNTQPIVDADGNFVVAANPGKYDIVFQAFEPLTSLEISQGKKQFVPLRISGIDVAAGQAFDLGVVDLQEGGVVSGTVKDRAGHPLANIPIQAFASGSKHGDSLVAVTNEAGQFSLQGVDTDKLRFYDVVAAPRGNNGDSRLSTFDGPRYGEVRRVQVDTRLNASVDFVLDLALGSVRGRVVTPDDGALDVPFGDQGDQPGAEIIMNKVGDIPQENPLGNIEITSNPDGTFDVTGLVPGTYDCWTLASGYGSGFLHNIVVGNGEVNVGTVTLQAGQRLFGSLLRPDGTPPNKDEVNVVVAIRGGFEEVLVGGLTEDAAGNVTGYSISGFLPDKAYSLLVFNDDNDIQVLADNLVVNSLTRRDFTLTGRAPSILTQYSRAPDGSVSVQYDFTKALRNSVIDLDSNGIPDDSDPAKVIARTSGSGTLTYPPDWLSSDRRRARVVYTPANGEQRFSLRVAAVFDDQNNATGANYTTTSDFTYFLGIGKQKEQKFTNASGGSVQLEEDTSEFTAGAGVFGNKADDEVNVLFRVASTASDFTAAGANPRVAGAAMSVEKGIGAAAYPPEMGSAMEHLRATGVDPFSSFYDIFLPAGVSHFFPQDHHAQLCVAYDDSAPDPYSLNVYYFNTTSNEFLLQNENKSVDTDNHRICVSLGHASVFTVLSSSASVIAGAGYTGELTVMNFPNPFNLKPKTVTLQNPGSASASQTIDGTMIKVSVPPSVSGTADIEIFSVSGERVRTLHAPMTSAAHNYVEWDGRNDAGGKVASGTYVARMTIGGGNEKFFKMAVLK